MARKYGWLAVVLAVVFGGLFALTPRREWFGTGLGMVAVILLLAILLTPGVRRTAQGNKRASLFMGLGALALGALILVGGLVFVPNANAEVLAGAFSVLLLVGVLLIQLPRMAANVDSVVEAQKITAAARPLSQEFHPAGEVRDTLRQILESRGSLTRLVGPWFLLFCVFSLALADQDLWKRPVDRDHDLAVWLLLGLIVFLFVEAGMVLAVGIQWTRYIVTNLEPKWFAVPGKALWGLAWRWLIFGNLFARMDINSWLKQHLAGAPAWGIDGINQALLFIIFVLASPFALSLPAISLGRARDGGAYRTKAIGIVGRRYYLGAMMILAPYFVASWITNCISHLDPVARETGALLKSVLTFGTAIIALTYVSRVFLRGASLDGPASFGAEAVPA